MHEYQELTVLPWSKESEFGVLGGLLLDNAMWDFVVDILKPDHFYDKSHGTIFEIIGSLVNNSKPADVLTVYDQIEQRGLSVQIGLMQLNGLAQYVPSSANIRRYAEIIVERALMRGMLAAADKAREIAVEAGVPILERLDRAQAEFQGLQASRGVKAPEAIQDHVVGLLDRMQDLADGKIAPGIPTGIFSLDQMLGGGIKGGKQIILAARPSVGKSSFAEQICINLAMAGHGAAFFSQEMSNAELVDRAAANIGRISLENMQTGKLTDNEWGRLAEAVDSMRNLPLFFDEQAGLSLSDIQAKARALKKKHDIKLIVIDYIQLCSSSKDSTNRHHQIEELSRGIKTLAKQLDITFLTLSQLNREVEKRTTGRPVLSDLKESGSIEEDADVVMLLSRAMSDGESQVINCDMPKNRQGKVGGFSLGFEGVYQKWSESAKPMVFKSPPQKHFSSDF
jgi:replicative DNA helicase